MRSKHTEKNFISTGISSILLVFVVLCLITFAVLSLSSANGDLTLSRREALRTQAYYAAENRANDRLKEIDEKIFETYNKEKGQDTYAEALIGQLQELQGLAMEECPQGLQICFSETIEPGSELQITLTAAYPEEQNILYRVDGWQVVQTEVWEEEPLRVLRKQE